ncbi:MAG: DNA repair protein RecN [Cytophagales bacterium]|jgi:DNA repair protein RecN (Recombination protein N)|nr:DNA repair protein RecN [Bacteroidota bacterium]MBS1982106.1 DNA repair protein RecN [Bacteroidota bacterium]WHZ06421.1 MAG: DNA repair protein RecN [Cytophagales bacterium]
MLTSLSIKNFALIRELELKPSSHLNVITGETGAGKSILLGAIGLLLGNRADAKSLWNENEKCIVEGVFDISEYHLQPLFEEENLDYANQTGFRREINPQGKSRAFINDTPVTLEVMKKIGSRLMEIHSQHETLELGKHQFQLSLIDSFAENKKIKTDYQNTWEEFLKLKKKYDDVLAESTTLRQETEFLKFQLDELTQANLIENEQSSLENELKILEHAEEIKSKLITVTQQLGDSEFSVIRQMASVKNEFNTIAAYSKEVEHLLARLESARIELNDIFDETERINEKTEVDPKRTEYISERLSLIYHLQQKHRVNHITDLLRLQQSLQIRFTKATNIDHEVDQVKKELTQSETQLNEKAKKLSDSRTKTFQPLCRQLMKLLQELGMPDARLEIVNEITNPSAAGIDRIEILFSANKGIAPKSLAQVASGGEFSRVMFSIKYVMAEKKMLPTLVLDEIDTGVSGEVAIRLGNRMKEMSQRHQVIAISHLPQIAAKADAHYFVFKNSSSLKTESQIKKLNDHDRVVELAKMIGGEKPSAINLENAKELMEG